MSLSLRPRSPRALLETVVINGVCFVESTTTSRLSHRFSARTGHCLHATTELQEIFYCFLRCYFSHVIEAGNTSLYLISANCTQKTIRFVRETNALLFSICHHVYKPFDDVTNQQNFFSSLFYSVIDKLAKFASLSTCISNVLSKFLASFIFVENSRWSAYF